MLNRGINMVYDFDDCIQTYKWTPYVPETGFGNKIPFKWKCGMCGTITEVLETDATKTYPCSNIHCKWKLKFVM